MRIPKQPPSTQQIFGELTPDQIESVFLSGIRSTEEGKYLHWDELLHRTPPQGYSHKTWWLNLKMARLSQSVAIPLADEKGQHFQFNIPSEAHALLHELTQRASGTIGIADQVTNPETRNRYLVRNLMEEGIRSSQIEGASTTRAIAKEMLRSSRPPRDESEQMILNNYVAMQHIIDSGDEALTPEFVLELHKLITVKTLDDPSAAGRLRTPYERIDVIDPRDNEVLHIPPPAAQLPDRLQQMCDFANGKTPGGFVHPVLRSIFLHFWLAFDHPFKDGNGRCARALFYWSMLRQEYWLCQFISISEIIHRAPAKYARSFLFTETDDNDLTYFMLHQLDVLRKAVDELHAYINQKLEDRRELDTKARLSEHLNERQVRIIAHALRNPGEHYVIDQHSMIEGVVYQTARTDLLKLVELGLFTRRKRGRTWNFYPVADLERTLEAVCQDSTA